MKKVIITKGLPASGKSTWAKEMCENDKKYVRVNKDDIRNMFHQEWSSNLEKTAVETEIRAAVSAIRAGFNVIVDDTNLNPKTVEYIIKSLRVVYDENAVEIEEKFFDVDPKVCIERDKEREGKACVGAGVIMSMYNKWLKPSNENTQ